MDEDVVLNELISRLAELVEESLLLSLVGAEASLVSNVLELFEVDGAGEVFVRVQEHDTRDRALVTDVGQDVNDLGEFLLGELAGVVVVNDGHDGLDEVGGGVEVEALKELGQLGAVNDAGVVLVNIVKELVAFVSVRDLDVAVSVKDFLRN